MYHYRELKLIDQTNRYLILKLFTYGHLRRSNFQINSFVINIDSKINIRDYSLQL